jgi:hypothetical protein
VFEKHCNIVVNIMDPAFIKYSGQSSPRFFNHQWAIIAEINRALDGQEYTEVEDHHQQAGPAKLPNIKLVIPGTHDDTGVQDMHAVEPQEPDFTERFQYMSFSHGPLMCRQTHCMGHPRKTPQTCTPTLLSISEVKEEVKTETV